MGVISCWLAVKATGLNICGGGWFLVQKVWGLTDVWVGDEELQHTQNWDVW